MRIFKQRPEDRPSLEPGITDYEAFLNEVSLRGEFARKLAADTSLSDADKKRIAALGFKALAGNLREDIKVR